MGELLRWTPTVLVMQRLECFVWVETPLGKLGSTQINTPSGCALLINLLMPLTVPCHSSGLLLLTYLRKRCWTPLTSINQAEDMYAWTWITSFSSSFCAEKVIGLLWFAMEKLNRQSCPLWYFQWSPRAAASFLSSNHRNWGHYKRWSIRLEIINRRHFVNLLSYANDVTVVRTFILLSIAPVHRLWSVNYSNHQVEDNDR